MSPLFNKNNININTILKFNSKYPTNKALLDISGKFFDVVSKQENLGHSELCD